MEIWYCLECGDYQLSVPRTRKSVLPGGTLWECDLCKTMSISKIDERNRALRQFAKQMETEFPSRIFEDLRPQYRPLNYLIESVVEAKCFINIVAESIDKFFVGLLAPKLYQKDMAISIII